MAGNLNILIVEDDLIDRTQLERLLHRSSLPVKTMAAERLESASQVLKTNSFDVVLLDLNLPDSNGLETLTTLCKRHPNVSIIVTTGEHGEDLGLKAVASGAQDYLIKGEFDTQTLVKSINYSIERRKLKEALLASIGQLAAGIAHEMNTPIGFVAGNLETLEKYVKKFKILFSMYADMASRILVSDKDQIAAKLAEIDKTAKDMKFEFVFGDIEALFTESKEGLSRVVKIIRNLREFSRIDQAEEFDEFDINQGIETTIILARNSLKYYTDITTEFADVPHVSCNAGQINQVFLNILVNAAQAIESQQRETKGNIKIKTYSTDKHVVCEISDDGPGIPPDVIGKVFDPFFTTKPVGKGTGLGLAVSRDIIVNKHTGELLVDSIPGKGAKFTIKLPIKVSAATQTEDKGIKAGVAAADSVS